MASDGKVVISTALDNSGLTKGISQISGQFGGLKNVVKSLSATIASAFAISKIVSFASEASEAARTLSDSLTGLQSILEGQGRSFSAAQDFIESYIDDGLVPATNAINAYKNLALRGYDDSQIQQVMTALKDASAYGRQAGYTMGEAVESATEGLKNENSVLVDNAGVTKNVAKMWEEYAASIGTTASNLTQQQKIQAEVAGILEETKFQTGDAAKVATTLSGQLLQLSYRFNDLKVAVGNAVNPIVQKLLPILNTAITALTRFANAVASVVGALFGKATVQSNTLADANESVAASASAGTAAEEELANATTAAGKAAKKSLASFDELSKLQSDSGSSGGTSSEVSGGGASGGTSIAVEADVEDTISPKLQAIVDKIHTLLEPLQDIDFGPISESFDRLKDALEPLTKKLFSGLEWAWENILVPLAEWAIEDAAPASIDLFRAALDLLNTVLDGLQPLAEWLWEDFLKPIATWTGGVIVDVLNAMTDALDHLTNWIRKNQGTINNFLILLGSISAAVVIVSTIANIVSWLKKAADLAPNVGLLAALFPQISNGISTAAGWITGTLIPAVTNALGGIAGALGISVGWVVAIVAAVAAAVAAIIIYWDEIVAAVSAAWEAVKEVWNIVAGWFDENVIQPVVAFFTDLWTDVSQFASDAWEAIKEFFSPAVEWFGELFGSVFQTISDIFYNIGVIASGCWEIIKEVWNRVSSWFNKNVIQPVAGFFESMWSNVTGWASGAWEGIKEVFGKVAEFFGNVFGDAWDAVVDIFSVAGEIFVDIKDGVLNAFKEIVNAIIGGINKVVSIPFEGINSALRAVRDVNILGLRPFSGIQTISVPQIPYLAQGAVIPPNREFLAVLGDQRHGTNIEAPLSTIQEAVALVMEDMTGGMMAGFEATVAVLQEILEAILGIEVGDEVIAKAVQRYQSKMAVVKGGN